MYYIRRIDDEVLRNKLLVRHTRQNLECCVYTMVCCCSFIHWRRIYTLNATHKVYEMEGSSKNVAKREILLAAPASSASETVETRYVICRFMEPVPADSQFIPSISFNAKKFACGGLDSDRPRAKLHNDYYVGQSQPFELGTCVVLDDSLANVVGSVDKIITFTRKATKRAKPRHPEKSRKTRSRPNP